MELKAASYGLIMFVCFCPSKLLHIDIFINIRSTNAELKMVICTVFYKLLCAAKPIHQMVYSHNQNGG